MKTLTLAVATLLILQVFARTPFDCSYTFKNPDETYPLTAKFDISPLHADDYWRVRDSSQATRNYTYYFNVCDNVHTMPVPPSGTSTSCQNPDSPDTLYPAYQVSNFGNGCYRLSNGQDDVKWRLMDNHDPTTGVIYSYVNGDESWCSSPRSFEIQLLCHDNSFFVPDEEVVQEDNCVYKLLFKSLYGCPLECTISNNKLCGGNGVCRFDTDSRVSHCYCNDGFGGASCDPVDPLKMNTTTVILCVVSGFLLIVEIVIFVLWKKVKSLRLDPAAYALGNTDTMQMV